MTVRRFLSLAFVSAVLFAGCPPVPPPVPPLPATKLLQNQVSDVVTQAPLVGAAEVVHTDLCGDFTGTSDSAGQHLFTLPRGCDGGYTLTVQASGYATYQQRFDGLARTPQGELTAPLPASDGTMTPSIQRLSLAFPLPFTRDQRLRVHESFQGAVLHTTQFGDLNWYPPAFVSLNATDRESYYAQAAAWGDTDVTVATRWNYGEPGQPYGSGQLVPPADFTTNWLAYRALVEDVLEHKTADGQPFVPVVYLNCDTGYEACLQEIAPLAAALGPQTGNLANLARDYVKFRICYDSCIPGWQPPGQVDAVLLALRAAVPDAVIGIEFASGYSFWGPSEGVVQFSTPAGQALDEVSWEGNSWPSDNPNQYWGILDHWLGPCFVRPASMPAAFDPDAPYQAGNAKWYLRMGTPRGPFHVDILEPFTYQWVRGQVPAAQVPVALAFIRSMLAAPSCADIDLPQ